MVVVDNVQQNGSGTSVQEINKFIKSFEMTQKMMKKVKSNKGGLKKLMNNMNLKGLKQLLILSCCVICR